MEWGFKNNLNLKKKVLTSREKEGWKLWNYSFKQFSKSWRPEITEYLEQHPESRKKLIELINSADSIFIDYLAKKTTEKVLKYALEKIYQLILALNTEIDLKHAKNEQK